MRRGARLPGLPLHNLNARLGVRLGSRWRVDLTMIAHSGAVVRGNESNTHRAGCYAYDTGNRLQPCDETQAGQDAYEWSPGRIPGFAVFHLRSRYALGDGLGLFAQVDNLFDRQYATAGRLGSNPFVAGVRGVNGPSGWNYNSAEWGRATFVGPGGPRALWIGVDYRF